MSEPSTAFDAKQALARVSELVRSASARAGKGTTFRPEDHREVIEALGELIVNSSLPLADIAQSVNVFELMYAETLGAIWHRMGSDRRVDATQWIEGLLVTEGNLIRRLLIPIIAEQDPRSARLILPARPNALDSAKERKRLAKSWLGRDLGPFGALLAGELVEYEVTRVLRLLLRLAGEPSVAGHIRSQAICAAAQALADHNLAEGRADLDPIFTSLSELLAALPSVDISVVRTYLLDRTPSVATRLNLIPPVQGSSAKEVVLSAGETALPVLEQPSELLEQQVPPAEFQKDIQVTARDKPSSLTSAAAETSSTEIPTLQHSQQDDDTLISVLETRAREHRDSAVFLEHAALRLKGALEAMAALQKIIAALKKGGDSDDKRRQTLEDRIETLSNDLIAKDKQLRATTEELRSKARVIIDLERSVSSLSVELADARNSMSTTLSRFDALEASHKSEMETLVNRVSSQTEQRLEEFRNDLGRRISEILRGTPALDSVNSGIDGKAILFRLWELIEALKRKSIPIRSE